MQEDMLLQKKPSGLRLCIYILHHNHFKTCHSRVPPGRTRIWASLGDSQYPSPATESFANILKRFNAECTNDGKISCNGRNWSPS